MSEIIKLGDKVESSYLRRYNLQDNTQGRIALITDRVIVKNLIYDETTKTRYEATLEQANKVGLRLLTYCFIPIAELITTPDGTIASNSFTVSYLQLSANTYKEFATSIQEVPNCTTILVSRVTKKVREKDYSTFTFKPSTSAIDATLSSNLAAIRANKESIETFINMIDSTTSTPFSQHPSCLGEKQLPAESNSVKAIESKQVEGSVSNSVQTSAQPMQNQQEGFDNVANMSIDDILSGL